MKTAIVTGAFGFAGANLVEELISSGYFVYAIGRPGSSHNERLSDLLGIKRIFLEMEDYDKLPEFIDAPNVDFFFHLAWGGGRNDSTEQLKNVAGALKALNAAYSINPSIRFIATGSQAEYGVVSFETVTTEETPLMPITAYGLAKVSAYNKLIQKSKDLGCDFIWARLFSLIGKYEPSGRLFPDLVNSLKEGKEVSLSSCTQYWDYLDARDAARALIALAENGRSGEAYNIASATPRPLKEYVEEIADIIDQHKLNSDSDTKEFSDLADGKQCGLHVHSSTFITYGPPPSPFVSLRPSITKLVSDTSWQPTITISETIKQNYMI